MAITTGDLIVKTHGTIKTLESNGAAIAAAAYGPALIANYTRSVDGADAPDLKIALSLTFAVAPVSGDTITLFARRLNVDGANDTPVPSANFADKRLGFLIVSPVAAIQYLETVVRNIPKDMTLYIRNDTGQSINLGWTAKVVAETIGQL